MFLIIGINNGEKQLVFDQLEVCKVCGRYGHMKIFMTYTYLMFFFIPVFKWNRRYYVKMDCCDAMSEIDKVTGSMIQRGQLKNLDYNAIKWDSDCSSKKSQKICSHCGYQTNKDFDFCPKCGQKFL